MVNLIFDSANRIRISGSMDIFCAERVKAAIEQRAAGHLTLDMRHVRYLDSAGLGVLISLYKECKLRGAAFAVIPSDPVKRVLAISNLDTLFIPERQSEEQPAAIQYYDCLESDTKLLSSLIDRLFTDLAEAGYCEEEAQEIVAAFDEAATNAMFETIRETNEMLNIFLLPNAEKPPKIVVVCWKITQDSFSATVVDHGSGLDITREGQLAPDTRMGKEGYLQRVGEHQHECNLQVNVNGEAVELKRLGMGLKIMTSLMDNVHITLIDPYTMISDAVSGDTMGTILTLHRARRLPRVQAAALV